MAKKKQKKSRAAKRKGMSTSAKKTYPTTGFSGHIGFHAKEASQIGAARARSMGNRLNKGS